VRFDVDTKRIVENIPYAPGRGIAYEVPPTVVIFDLETLVALGKAKIESRAWDVILWDPAPRQVHNHWQRTRA